MAAVALPAGPRPGYVWNADDWETTYNYRDIDCSLAEDLEPGQVMRVGRAAVMTDIWITRDAHDELHECATPEQAQAIAAQALEMQRTADAEEDAHEASS